MADYAVRMPVSSRKIIEWLNQQGIVPDIFSRSFQGNFSTVTPNARSTGGGTPFVRTFTARILMTFREPLFHIMDNKKYNQMGFDFGDTDPAQESPAAGFRIKSLKPASKADSGESEQEKGNQKDLTAKNGVNAPVPPTADDTHTEFMPAGKTLETVPGKQQGESNPNNDSEVIRNTPVVSEQEVYTQSHEPADEIRQEHHLAEKPAVSISAEPVAEAPEAEEPQAAPEPAFTPNIPSRLTRPTQVYAVEEKETEQPIANEIPGPIAAIAETTAAEEPAQPYNTAQEQAPSEEQQEMPPAQEEEYFITEEPGHGVNFNTPEPEPELILPKKSTRGRKSLKTLDAEAGAVNIPEDSTLFKRQYYSIGEVAGMFGVNQSLLRFWENEFDIIQPRKNRKGDRHFRPVDIKNLELIYDLLRRRKLTIEGAKEFLKKNKQARERFEMIQSLQQIRSFLLEIKASL
jgi:DNA-binding transcriptional MerR regulator